MASVNLVDHVSPVDLANLQMVPSPTKTNVKSSA
ncbi:unknown protein [Simkania negevensis Z]|uniref:Uncharacterized protein n=1 Tax=Simkania negevensis (strain ATCC VR-1471 / DSM 27360 / Z) TaxID=331113 RepID=F8L7Q7_SIMNZ|nr:unknown protein [Simkania negevensis Z]